MNSFWQDKPMMIAHLNEVNKVIGRQLTVKQKKMNEILQDLALSGGKRIRPALCVMGAGFGTNQWNPFIHLLLFLKCYI